MGRRGYPAGIDRGVYSGLSSGERAELEAARRRIRELETELAVHRRATELSKGQASPRARFAGAARPGSGPCLQLAGVPSR
jgi:hypothetical protein